MNTTKNSDMLGAVIHDANHEIDSLRAQLAAAEAERDRAVEDSERLDYIERTFSGMTNRERYMPVQMIWGKGCNGRTLREACDKYMAREKAIASAAGEAASR